MLLQCPLPGSLKQETRMRELVAFDVAEFGAKYYAIYMFNFSSKDRYIPGASDLLLSGVINQAITEQKKYINLGLGISPGVTFFKKKWGGTPFPSLHFLPLFSPSRGEIRGSPAKIVGTETEKCYRRSPGGKRESYFQRGRLN